MNSNVYKWCGVPLCKNTSLATPNKLFVYVPKKETVRVKWLKLARRNPAHVVTSSTLYFCEDHFDLPNDMENYMQYHLMGSVSQVRMKPGSMPKKFECQPDRKTRTLHTIERPYILKKRRMMILKECKKQSEESSIVTEHLEEIASGSSVQHNLEESQQVISKIIEKSNQINVTKFRSKANQTEVKLVVFNARGLMPPVFTPLNDDLTINYGAIPGYAQYLQKSGIKSVLVGGTTGENMSLSVADRKKIVDTWVAASKTTGLHIQVQVGGAPLPDVTDLAKHCATVGADSLLTLPELYFKPKTVDELVSYIALVAQAAPSLPVLYYHIPSMSKVEINMPAFVASATACIPNFKGIKFTSNDLAEAAQVLRTLKGDQEMFLGADTLLAPAALLGIKSSIGTSVNMFPQLAHDILAAVEANDIEKARLSQEKLSLAVEAHTIEGDWVPVMKAGMEIVSGIKVGPPSLPQKPISAEARKRIEGRLRKLKLVK